MTIKNTLIFTIILVIFAGCSNKQIEKNVQFENKIIKKDNSFKSASLEKTIQKQKNKQKNKFQYIKNEDLNLTTTKNPSNDLNKKFYSFYKQWEGVRYQLGGSSKKGIDCSAFIQKAFKEKFNLSMPRTTVLQSKVGKEITKDELVLGDLVFFKTGRSSKHVGIYIEDGKFMHASTKYGVTISELDNVYFKNKYWKAQRIID
uniref:NlpC/P60 family protein n=1 Tax=Aliarcobacter sp. TaxID=2321116 RepID=UPI0040479DF5